MLKFVGIAAFEKAVKAELKKFEDEAIAEMKEAARVVVKSFTERTPAWSGETVRNYTIGIGSPAGGGVKTPSGSLPAPGENVGLAPGEERNHAINAAAAMRDAETVMKGFTKLQDLYLTNTVRADKWDLIDHGNAPFPGLGRNPGGVSTLAEQSARNRLKNFK